MSQDQAHFKNKMNTKHQTTKDHTECIVDLFGATELLNKGQILSLAKTANTHSLSITSGQKHLVLKQ
jgi:hypothetical protein